MDIYDKIDYCLEHLRDVPDDFKESTEMLKKWLKKPDADGLRPEIFITMSNRTGGKTYFLAYLLLDLYRRFGVQFALQCRTGSELGNVASGIFSAVLEEFDGWSIEEVIAVNNVYSVIYVKYTEIDEEGKEVKNVNLIGYVLSINASDKIKKYSSTFYDVDTYLPKEVNKWINVHMSVARGHGQASRCVPVLMASNSLTIVNPYFEMWKLESKIQYDTKFYRGRGLSVLRFVNNAVAPAQSQSRFNIACAGNEQLDSNISNSWLNDNRACVCKPEGSWGRAYYIATFIKGDESFGFRQYDNGMFYVNRNVDETCTNIYALTVDGMENVECAKRSVPLQVMEREFTRGNVRFSDLSCKYTMLDWI